MPFRNRRDRGALVALALALAAIIIVSMVSYELPNRPVGQQYSSYAEDHQEPYGPAEGHWRPEFSARDTYAQWAMAVLALAATVVSVKAIYLVRDTLVESRRAVEAANEANRTAREIGEAQIRAYPTIEWAEVSLGKEGDEIVWEIRLAIYNSGQSPAKIIGIYVAQDNERREGAILRALRPGESRETAMSTIKDISRSPAGPDATHVFVDTLLYMNYIDVFNKRIGEIVRIAGSVRMTGEPTRVGIIDDLSKLNAALGRSGNKHRDQPGP